MHGSKTGFYSEDVADAAFADPEHVRTADLRGASFTRTDLFRVDLRGARLDPRLLEAARRMGAFVDG